MALLWRRGFTEDVLLHWSSRRPHANPKASKEWSWRCCQWAVGCGLLWHVLPWCWRKMIQVRFQGKWGGVLPKIGWMWWANLSMTLFPSALSQKGTSQVEWSWSSSKPTCQRSHCRWFQSGLVQRPISPLWLGEHHRGRNILLERILTGSCKEPHPALLVAVATRIESVPLMMSERSW